MKNKLCLGTVKVGVPSYGHSLENNIDNHSELFLRATEIGITCFDTSPRYNNSEKIIGSFVKKYNKKLFISTKIDNLTAHNKSIIQKMRESVLRSIENLGVDFIDLCYLHQNELSIISDKYILEGIEQLKYERLIDKAGVSIYDTNELDFALKYSNFDWVQIPVNILDPSFYSRIVKSNSTIKIAARSIFLQGIMFNNNATKKHIPDADRALELLECIKLLGYQYNLKLIDIAVAYVYSLQSIDQVLIGTTSITNLEKVKEASKILLGENIKNMIDEISIINKIWTNPRMWT